MVFNKPEVTIGRVQGNDIVLPKGNVSKRHARIVLKDGKFIIVDLKSTNGTYVNGERSRAARREDSDKIYIGDFIGRCRRKQRVQMVMDRRRRRRHRGTRSRCIRDGRWRAVTSAASDRSSRMPMPMPMGVGSGMNAGNQSGGMLRHPPPPMAPPAPRPGPPRPRRVPLGGLPPRDPLPAREPLPPRDMAPRDMAPRDIRRSHRPPADRAASGWNDAAGHGDATDPPQPRRRWRATFTTASTTPPPRFRRYRRRHRRLHRHRSLHPRRSRVRNRAMAAPTAEREQAPAPGRTSRTNKPASSSGRREEDRRSAALGAEQARRSARATRSEGRQDARPPVEHPRAPAREARISTRFRWTVCTRKTSGRRRSGATIDLVETLETSGELPKYIDQDSLIKRRSTKLASARSRTARDERSTRS